MDCRRRSPATGAGGAAPAAVTDAYGRFRIVGLEPGLYDLFHDPPTLTRDEQPVHLPRIELEHGDPLPAGTENVRVTLPPGALWIR